MTQSHRRRQGMRGAQEKCSLGSHHLQHGLLNWETQSGDYEGESGSYQNSPQKEVALVWVQAESEIGEKKKSLEKVLEVE